MKIRTLFVDDNEEICNQMNIILQGLDIGGNILTVTVDNNFNDAINRLDREDYDLIILDVFEGSPYSDTPNESGKDVLEKVKERCFAPVIFFTARVNSVEEFKSDFVKVINKGDGNQILINEIRNLLDTKIIQLKIKLNDYVKDSLREYLWNFVYPNWGEFNKIKDNKSLSFLLIKRLTHSLSKDQIIKLIDVDENTDKLYPMEFYICPPISKDYEAGDILKLGGNFYVILTPSCDLVIRTGKPQKAERVMLAKCNPLENHKKFKSYKRCVETSNTCTLSPESDGYKEIQAQLKNSKGNLERLIKSTDADRYFFLPKTFFIDNFNIDFEDIYTINYSDLSSYTKIAKIDDPISQSMISSFIRWYNRIGFEDIDTDYVINNLDT